MGKENKTIYRCQQCGYESSRWLGRCPDCGEWNSIIEELVKIEEKKGLSTLEKERMIPLPITKVSINKNLIRYHSGIDEFDRVLGGGIVPGSLVLVGGEPGIGKSTLFTKLYMGGEFNLLSILKLRGGFYQGYPSFGFGLLGLLNYALYGRELSTMPGLMPEWNHVISLSLGF